MGAVTQREAEQLWPVAQRLPQLPQLVGSVLVSVQPDEHIVLGAVHVVVEPVQLPLTQRCPDEQAKPQRPQLPTSLDTSTQVVPHITRGAVQVPVEPVQVLDEHV